VSLSFEVALASLKHFHRESYFIEFDPGYCHFIIRQDLDILLNLTKSVLSIQSVGNRSILSPR
jgi:hypothetical protein